MIRCLRNLLRQHRIAWSRVLYGKELRGESVKIVNGFGIERIHRIAMPNKARGHDDHAPAAGRVQVTGSTVTLDGSCHPIAHMSDLALGTTLYGGGPATSQITTGSSSVYAC